MTKPPSKAFSDRALGPDPDSYGCHEDYLRDIRAGGIDVIDYYGRLRIPVHGDGPNAAVIEATYPIRRSARPVLSSKVDARAFWRGYEAVALANLKGFTLNAFLTVSWGSIGIEGAAAWRAHQHFTSLLTNRFADWREPEPGFVWVRECGTKLGDHSHVLLHLNPFRCLDVERWSERAVATVAGTRPLAEKGGKQTVHLSMKRPGDVVGQWALFRYIFKGVDPETVENVLPGSHGRMMMAEFAGLNPRAQGEVAGKRSGVSNSLAQAQIDAYHEEWGLPAVWPRFSQSDRRPLYDDTFLQAGAAKRAMRDLDRFLMLP